MKKIAKRYLSLKSHKIFYLQLGTGILLFCASIFFNHFAQNYTATHFSNSVNDIILDNIPTKNVDAVFLEGFMFFIGFVAFLGFHKPARIPFILKASAMFICVRAFFMILTHLAPPLNQSIVDSQNIIERLLSGSGDDLFFSGHTGFPFLMALIFWENIDLRWIFLIASAFFGGAVLLGHLHYSIDVFSAYFITYGIFNAAKYFFKNDYEFFLYHHKI